jgi:hypothetical protein
MMGRLQANDISVHRPYIVLREEKLASTTKKIYVYCTSRKYLYMSLKHKKAYLGGSVFSDWIMNYNIGVLSRRPFSLQGMHVNACMDLLDSRATYSF